MRFTAYGLSSRTRWVGSRLLEPESAKLFNAHGILAASTQRRSERTPSPTPFSEAKCPTMLTPKCDLDGGAPDDARDLTRGALSFVFKSPPLVLAEGAGTSDGS